MFMIIIHSTGNLNVHFNHYSMHACMILTLTCQQVKPHPKMFNDCKKSISLISEYNLSTWLTSQATYLLLECCCLSLQWRGLSLHGIDALLLQCHPQNILLGKHVCGFSCHLHDVLDQVGRDEPCDADAPLSNVVEYQCRSGECKLVCK